MSRTVPASDLLVDTLSSHIPRGRRSGEEFVGPCPFHKDGQEKRPSFSINLESGLSFCFTCQEGWSLKTLLRGLGVTGSEASALAARLPGSGRRRDPFKGGRMFAGTALPETLLLQFKKCPAQLLDAGFEMDTLRHFEVGYDSHLDRITYPIRNHRGVLVGLFGRIPDNRLDAEGAKYKPYQKELQDVIPGYKFGKKQYLWNMHHLYTSALKGEVDQVVLVEGFKQLMWVWQSGYKNVLALMGSYMSKPQQILLQRVGGEVIVLLDNDKAGKKGTLHVDKKLRGLQKVKACTYPEGKSQPDDMGLEEVRECINNATDMRTWRKRNVIRP